MGKKALSKSATDSGRTFWDVISFIPAKGYNDPKVAKTFHDRSLNLKRTRQLTGIIEKEGDGYVALCPELDIASQGDSIEEARKNLIEALELFFETADASEIDARLHDEVFITRLEVAVG
jgi:predicted RNase H-like HicB family nuclease